MAEDSPTPSQAGQAPAHEESTNAAVQVVFTQEEQSILDAALENMAGDQDLLNETIAVFLAEYPNTLKRIQMATKAGKAETIEGEAASLKNAAGNLGAKDAFNAALQIEQLGKNQTFTADAGQTSRTMRCELLRQQGIQNIREVEDGVAALNALHEAQPHLIISDWHLSGIRSIDLLHIIRQDDKLKAIPMVMVTDTATRAEVIEAYQAGVNG